MKNEYIIDGDVTRIILKKRNGEVFETLIDTEDLPKLLDFRYSWTAAYLINPKSYYAHSTVYLGIIDGKPQNKTIGMHCFLLGVDSKEGVVVDHINHNTLDNRKENLRITTNGNNVRHREYKNCNNKSGYRNVSFYNGKWLVQLQIDGKNTKLGEFDNVENAGLFAKQMRKKYYGKFAGKD